MSVQRQQRLALLEETENRPAADLFPAAGQVQSEAARGGMGDCDDAGGLIEFHPAQVVLNRAPVGEKRFYIIDGDVSVKGGNHRIGKLQRTGRARIIQLDPVLHPERQFRHKVVAPENPSFILNEPPVYPAEKPPVLEIVDLTDEDSRVVVAQHTEYFNPGSRALFKPASEIPVYELETVPMGKDIAAGDQ